MIAIARNDNHAPFYFKGEEYKVVRSYKGENLDGENVRFYVVKDELGIESDIEEGCDFLDIKE